MRYLPKAGVTVVYEEIFIPDIDWAVTYKIYQLEGIYHIESTDYVLPRKLFLFILSLINTRIFLQNPIE